MTSVTSRPEPAFHSHRLSASGPGLALSGERAAGLEPRGKHTSCDSCHSHSHRTCTAPSSLSPKQRSRRQRSRRHALVEPPQPTGPDFFPPTTTTNFLFSTPPRCCLAWFRGASLFRQPPHQPQQQQQQRHQQQHHHQQWLLWYKASSARVGCRKNPSRTDTHFLPNLVEACLGSFSRFSLLVAARTRTRRETHCCAPVHRLPKDEQANTARPPCLVQ